MVEETLGGGGEWGCIHDTKNTPISGQGRFVGPWEEKRDGWLIKRKKDRHG